jgi:hypothetical protein
MATTAAPTKPAVQDCQPLPKPVEYTLTDLSSIIPATPPHAILLEETASLVYAAM